MVRGVAAAWVLILALGILDAGWAACVRVSFAGGGRVALVAAGLLAVALFYGATGRSRRLSSLAQFGALWVAFTAAAAVLSYLAVTLDAPLRDADFARLDGAFGFDWPTWFAWVGAHPLLETVLAAAYASLMPQIVGSLLLFSLSGRDARNAELLWTVMLAFLVTVTVSALAPAVSAYAHFGPVELANAYHLPDLLALRSGAPAEFEISALRGIITFPSFHTTLALLLVYAHRSNRFVFAGAAALNGVMLLSVPSEGGHYLVDMLAGAAVAALAIAAVRSRRQPAALTTARMRSGDKRLEPGPAAAISR